MLRFRLSTLIISTTILAIQFRFFRNQTANCLAVAIGIMAILTMIIGTISLLFCKSKETQLDIESNAFVPPLLKLLQIISLYGLLTFFLLFFLGPGV